MADEAVPLNYLPILLFIGITIVFAVIQLLAGLVLLERGQPATAESREGLKLHDSSWVSRQMCAWKGATPLAICNGATAGEVASSPRCVGRDHRIGTRFEPSAVA